MWWTIGAFLAGLVVGTVTVFIYMAESLGPWIKYRESVMQREMALEEMRRAGTLLEDGHKRSEFRSEL
jgi:hypothetical protein